MMDAAACAQKRTLHMTRETKLGLAVGTSFLSLVAVVAFHAWNKNDDPSPPPEVPPPPIAKADPGQPPPTSGPGLATPGLVTVGSQVLSANDLPKAMPSSPWLADACWSPNNSARAVTKRA